MVMVNDFRGFKIYNFFDICKHFDRTGLVCSIFFCDSENETQRSNTANNKCPVAIDPTNFCFDTLMKYCLTNFARFFFRLFDKQVCLFEVLSSD